MLLGRRLNLLICFYALFCIVGCGLEGFLSSVTDLKISISNIDPITKPGDELQFFYTLEVNNTADSVVTDIKLYYTYDDSQYVEALTLASNIMSSSQNYRWTIPANAPSTRQARVKLVATNKAGEEVSAVSSPFSILTQASDFIGSHSLVGGSDGVSANALFNNPKGMVRLGSYLYITIPSAILKVDVTDPVNPSVSLFAGSYLDSGSQVGVGKAARFTGLWGIETDGVELYVADAGMHAIYKVNVSTAEVALYAGIPGQPGLVNSADPFVAQFKYPRGLAFIGTDLYVADSSNHAVRKIDASGNVSLVAGSTTGLSGNANGIGTAARFNFPSSLRADVSDPMNPVLYVADTSNHAIRKITIADQNVVTLAGSGVAGYLDSTGVNAWFFNPYDLSVDGNNLYVTDFQNRTIRKIDKTNGVVTTVAGFFGTAGDADGAFGVGKISNTYFTYMDSGSLFLGNMFSVRKLDLASNILSTFLGNRNLYEQRFMPSTYAKFSGALLSLASEASSIYIADTNNHRIRKLDLSSSPEVVSTYAGSSPGYANGAAVSAQFKSPQCVYFYNGSLYVTDLNHVIRAIDNVGNVSLVAGIAGTTGAANNGTSSTFNNPRCMVGSGSILYVADSSNCKIRKLDLSIPNDPIVTTLVGDAGCGAVDGDFTTAKLKNPWGLALVGNDLYVSETGNHDIRKIDLVGLTVSTVAGTPGVSGANDGVGTVASFNSPRQLEVDASQQYLFVADRDNNKIRKVALSDGSVTTLVSSGGPSLGITPYMGKASAPTGIARVGDDLHFTTQSGLIQKLDVNTMYVSNSAGWGNDLGTSDGFANVDTFEPRSLVKVGSFYYAVDSSHNTIFKIDSNGSAILFSGTANISGWKDGSVATALYSGPIEICAIGNALYVAEYRGMTIRKIDLNTQSVSTVAGQSGAFGSVDGDGLTTAKLSYINSVFCDGDKLFFTESSNHVVRWIDLNTGMVTTLAGLAGQSGSQDGIGAESRFKYPYDLVKEGNNLYVTDSQNHTIRKIDVTNINQAVVSTFTGQAGIEGSLDGVGNQALFGLVNGLGSDGTFLYVGDMSHLIRRIRISNAEVSTFTGIYGSFGETNGDLNQALVYKPDFVSIIDSEIYMSNGVMLRKIK